MKRVLVVGDAIADVYSEYMFRKHCPDAPGTSAYVRRTSTVYAGGAANVATNLAVLSPATHIDLISIIDVPLARALKQASRGIVNVVDTCVFHDETLRKERIITTNMYDDHYLARLDNMDHFSSYEIESLTEKLRQYLNTHDPDLILVSDYAAGSLSEGSLELLLRFKDRMLVDTKLTDLSVFGGEQRTLGIKLNWPEYKAVMMTDHSPERHFGFLIVTDGARGATLKMQKQVDARTVTHSLYADAHRVTPVDTCGCGDTFLAGMAASLLKNDDPYTAMRFANAAASTVVTQPRTAVADLEKTLGLIGRLEENETS